MPRTDEHNSTQPALPLKPVINGKCSMLQSALKRAMLVYGTIIRWKLVCVSAAGWLGGGGSFSQKTDLAVCVLKLEPGSHTECCCPLLDRHTTETRPHTPARVCVCVSGLEKRTVNSNTNVCCAFTGFDISRVAPDLFCELDQ